jgi:hypothetical protein
VRKKDLTNIPPGQTNCSCCGELKDNTQFPYYKTKFVNKGPNNPLTGFRSRVNTICEKCRKEKQKDRASIKKNFKDLKEPDHGQPCESCGEKVTQNWQLDHCHKTGIFRGWLCKQCNTGIGNLGDDKSSVLKALMYLERAEKGENPSQKLLNGIR